METISFVIPCYRSELTIEKVINEIKTIVCQSGDYSYEIIAVNDCSPDDVLSVLRRMAESDKKVKVIDFMQNSGKDAAVLAGLSIASGEIAIVLDDDFQCPMGELWRLIEPIKYGKCDVTTAKYHFKKESFVKRVGSNLNMWSSQMMLGQPKGLRFENFLAISRKVYMEMLNYKNPYPFIDGLILRVTKRIGTVEMEERCRGDNRGTGFTLKKSISMFVDGLTAFSVKPLRIASIVGFLTASIGLLYMLYTIFFYFFSPEHVVEGYSSLLSVNLFIGGMLMMMIGLMGEYVGRIYICINQSPQYVIREMINIDQMCNKREK